LTIVDSFERRDGDYRFFDRRENERVNEEMVPTPVRPLLKIVSPPE
jgi:hypothetical protein